MSKNRAMVVAAHGEHTLKRGRLSESREASESKGVVHGRWRGEGHGRLGFQVVDKKN